MDERGTDHRDLERQSRALARFKRLVANRGCPQWLSMEEMVLQGYATMEETEDLRRVLEGGQH